MRASDRRLLAALACFLLALPVAPASAAEDWHDLFDGKTLAGWIANETPRSFQVVDGAIVCNGPRSHLFYMGPVQGARFRNFEFEAEVLARPGANSGIYFHTAFQDKDWLTKGYEVQINGSATGEGGYRENKRTGSLYGIRNVHRTLLPDDRWFTIRIRVLEKRVTIHVDDVLTVDYVEPPNAPNGGYRDRRLDEGTFALQCHDPGSRALYRKVRVRSLTSPADLSGPVPDPTAFQIPTELAALHANNFPVVDLHTHLKGGLTREGVLERQFRTGINAGIVVNAGLGFAVTNDAGLDHALRDLRHPLTYAGIQGEGREWFRLFSPEAIARFDYVITDAMTFSDDEGRRMRLWIPNEVRVADPQAFMDLLVRRTVGILENEPIHVWANPTFLPAELQPRYAELWTEERMDRVIAAAVKRGIAIEINDRFQLPSEAFIRRAQKAGGLFTFGTNNAGPDDLGRLDYGVRMARVCGLKWSDFWVPPPKPAP
ncbi:MAG: family 16 glycoside hydrolase [Limisphaerales bacterium]